VCLVGLSNLLLQPKGSKVLGAFIQKQTVQMQKHLSLCF
jgi:hypothetical protein